MVTSHFIFRSITVTTFYSKFMRNFRDHVLQHKVLRRENIMVIFETRFFFVFEEVKIVRQVYLKVVCLLRKYVCKNNEI